MRRSATVVFSKPASSRQSLDTLGIPTLRRDAGLACPRQIDPTCVGYRADLPAGVSKILPWRWGYVLAEGKVNFVEKNYTFSF